MPAGGKRPGAGRPKGATNKRTGAVREATQAAAERLEAVIPGAFKGDAHALLMAVYKDTSLEMPLRVDAAKAAVRYEKPALSSVTATIHHQPAAALTDDELARRIADLQGDLAGGPSGDAASSGGSGKPH